MRILIVILCTLLAPVWSADADAALPLPGRPAHGRPYLMPAAEHERILESIRSSDQARREFERLQRAALKGDGYAAALLFALLRDPSYVATATTWLRKAYGPGAYWVKRYRKNLADPMFFEGGQPHLADVYYGIDTQGIIAFDWLYDALDDNDRNAIRDGLLTCARFRMRAMDRWRQTANLVFKPTFVVALTGLVTGDQACLEWGFRRTRPWGPHIGGYFAALNHMIRDGGPWYEAPIYPIAHRDLVLACRMSRYLALIEGQDWFNRRLPRGGSVKGLMDYYVDTAYPIERRSDGHPQIRVATYGDGSTNARGDLFLVHPGGGGAGVLRMDEALAAAYDASGDAAYAAFLAHATSQKPGLWENRPIAVPTLESPAYPAAPSRVWPDFGIAMLRSEHTPAYWTSGNAIAVFHILSQGYGHDHRDKFSITLHGAGRLFYPDYNPLQYENMAIGWSRNSVAHNTVMVDEEDTRNAPLTRLDHDFDDDVSFLAGTATGVFDRVTQTRALLLTREYLLDVFHLSGAVPHTFDYLLHCFGRAEAPPPARYMPSTAMQRRFWLVDNQRTMTTSDSWSLDYVLDDAPAATLRLTMAAEADTQVTLGTWGNELAELVAQHRKGGEMDRLSMTAVRRQGRPQSVFIATHEPRSAGQTPEVRAVTKLAETTAGVVVRIDARTFTDFAAVVYAPDTSTTTFAFGDNGFAAVDTWAYLRVHRDGRVVGRGNWLGFAFPVETGGVRLILNDEVQSMTNRDGAIVFGRQSAPASAAADVEEEETTCPFPVVVTPAHPLQMFRRDRRIVTLGLTNILKTAISGHIEWELPNGVTVTPRSSGFISVPPGQAVDLPVTVATKDPAAGRHILPWSVHWSALDGQQRRSAPRALTVFAGTTLLNEYADREANHVVYSPGLTARFDMRNGVCRFLADPDGEVWLDGSPLFTFSDGAEPILNAATTNAFTWPREAPAALTAKATDQCRWQADFPGSRMAIRMDRDWTRFERTQVAVPGTWQASAHQMRWGEIIPAAAVSAPSRETQRVAAVELTSAEHNWSLAFRFEPPQAVTLDGLAMRFSIGSWNGDRWELGFCRPGELRAWCGME